MIVGWHQQLNGLEFEQTPGDCERQGSLVCCSPACCNLLQGRKGLDTTERPDNNNTIMIFLLEESKNEIEDNTEWKGLGFRLGLNSIY